MNGQLAPDVTLYNDEGNQVSISDYRGKNLVILFFPLAFTSVCVTEFCRVRDDLANYNNADAEVVGISVDSHFALARFKEDNFLNFSLLSDFDREAGSAYNTLYGPDEFALVGMKCLSRRAVFILDKEGIIRHNEVLESIYDLPDFTAVHNALARLK